MVCPTLLRAYRMICPAGEEENAPRKRSRFALINRINDKLEERSKRALEESMEYRRQWRNPAARAGTEKKSRGSPKAGSRLRGPGAEVRMKKSRRDGALGLGCIVAGAVFLFDPFVGVFDLLPDIIGYLLILRGLRRLALLRDTLTRLSACSGGLSCWQPSGFSAIPFIFGLTSSSEQPVEQLLVVFTLAILDCIVLFSGMARNRAGIDTACFSARRAGSSQIDAFGNSSTDRLFAAHAGVHDTPRGDGCPARTDGVVQQSER